MKKQKNQCKVLGSAWLCGRSASAPARSPRAAHWPWRDRRRRHGRPEAAVQARWARGGYGGGAGQGFGAGFSPKWRLIDGWQKTAFGGDVPGWRWRAVAGGDPGALLWLREGKEMVSHGGNKEEDGWQWCSPIEEGGSEGGSKSTVPGGGFQRW
jgi:hypothetical protein